MENIQDIVDAIRQAAEVLSQHPDDVSVQQALNVADRALKQLAAVFQQTGSLQDFNRIIECTELVLSVVPENHQFRVDLLTNLSIALSERFSMMGSQGNPDDLDRAVQLSEENVTATRPGTEERIAALGNLNQMLQNRYDHTRNLQDIKRAITVGQEAVEMIPEGWPHTARMLHKLAISLGRRSEQTGNAQDLDRAVDILTETVPQIPQHTRDYVAGLSYLATLLGIRFEQQGDVEDLNASIPYTKRVLKLMGRDDSDRPAQLYNLATRLAERGQYTGAVGDLDDAIDHGQQALSLAPQTHPERTNWLRGLSQFLGMRFRMGTKNLEDIQQAIDLSRQAAETVDRDDTQMRAAVANALSNLLKEKYEYDDNVAGLDEAIEVLGQVLQGGLSEDRPERGALEFGLGDVLRARYGRTGDATDLEKSREAFQRAWASLNSPLTIRMYAAIKAGEIAANWADEKHLKNDTPDPSVLLRYWTEASTDFDNAQQMLKRFAGLGAHAAAAALNAKKDTSYALQQLELGRGVISGLVLDLRTDLSFLRGEHPGLADQFSRLRNMLDSGHITATLSSKGSSCEAGAQARRQAEKEFTSLLTKIRGEKGFESFLMPPTVQQLMDAADPDPAVVVNVSSFRCDAFIVEKHRIRLLELPLLSLEDIQANTKRLKNRPDSLPSVLEWLWSSAVHPILDALGFDNPLALQADSWPHIWWIPVGPLNSLPLHAAGYHTKHSGETALDRVMSSYSSSLKSLLAGRLQKMPQYDSSPINALLVSMKSTPNRSPLRYAELEVNMLEKLCPALNATPIRPVQHKADVLTQLSRCDIFHFAGHGTSNALDPSQSALLLRDWEKSPLTVEDLRNERLQEKPPFLAYLSACSTGANEVLGLVDEGIHLGYACQLAGFRHIVGTLWTVSDPFCVNVARKFL
ncbi:hypothetical protein CEP52_001121 [Fusarium oligoseptatum]|uniref:CHAT domain-containing protein n=1 Tax=Fusarium oligoseptatum TaxID=2604345 RepID=A0A428UKS5_9HYPO|nr:hypothetical protein CEP52_001121 [Fusarium oligoseptatum]